MPGTYHTNVTRQDYAASREIKASAVYTVMPIGGTLDASKFSLGGLVLEGQCLAQNISTQKYEPYNQGTAVDADGKLAAGFRNPIVLDQSIQLEVLANNTNADVVFGQALVSGKVYAGMCIGLTPGFEAAMKNMLFLTV